jgi:hypothetical protein
MEGAKVIAELNHNIAVDLAIELKSSPPLVPWSTRGVNQVLDRLTANDILEKHSFSVAK